MQQVQLYQHKCTRSHQNSAVKLARARVVLGWVTSSEVLVLHSSFHFFQLFFCHYYYYYFYDFLRRWGEGSFRGTRGCHLVDLCEHILWLKIFRFDLLARAFPSVLYTKIVFKEFSAHSIAFNCCIVCFILLGGTWTCLSTGSHHY